MVSLFPKDTYKGHPFRKDLAQMLADMKPAFMRFPGGCYVEGNELGHAFRWKKTIGDVAERPGHYNLWGYWSNDGLGYHEYLQLCEDLGAEPLLRDQLRHGPPATTCRWTRWMSSCRTPSTRSSTPTGRPTQSGVRFAQGRPSGPVPSEVHGDRQRERRARSTSSGTPCSTTPSRSVIPICTSSSTTGPPARGRPRSSTSTTTARPSSSCGRPASTTPTTGRRTRSTWANMP